jgi:hypothetical protein
MPPPNDYRPPVFRNPYAPRRGGNQIRGFSQNQGFQMPSFEPTYAQPTPQEAAMGLYQIGMRADESGNLMPTQDFGGLMSSASSQINSMTRGVKPGQFSSLGKPLGSMYQQNPGFFKSGQALEGFGAAVSQRNQAMSQSPSQEVQTPAYRGPYRPGFTGVTEQQKTQNRAALQEQVDAKRMLGQATGDIPTTTYRSGMGVEYSPGRQASMASGETPIGKRDTVSISGKYGSGSSTFLPPGAPRKEGLINGKPASEVLQGLANKPGIARAGDRFQPQKDTPAMSAAMNKNMSKFPMKNPLLKR